jgi:hypothetical protein
MSEPPGTDFTKAVAILDRYYRAIVTRLAEEVLEHEEDFDDPFIGQAEGIIDRYWNHLYNLGLVYHDVRAFAEPESELEREVRSLRLEVGEIKRAITTLTRQIKALQEKLAKGDDKE